MKEIFEQYGSVLITVTAIVAVIGVIVFIIAGNGKDTSLIYTAFSGLLNDFLENAQSGDKIQIVTPGAQIGSMLLSLM